MGCDISHFYILLLREFVSCVPLYDGGFAHGSVAKEHHFELMGLREVAGWLRLHVIDYMVFDAVLFLGWGAFSHSATIKGKVRERGGYTMGGRILGVGVWWS